jgi:uncharacterized phiE125 gp8 family phage protein
MAGLNQTVAPTAYPVSHTDVMDQALLTDANIGAGEIRTLVMLIASVTRHVERIDNRQLVDATWAWTLPAFPCVLEMPVNPLRLVSSITYYDTAGTLQTLAAANYRVDASADPGIVAAAYGLEWPATYDIEAAVTVTFKAGYGGTSADLTAAQSVAAVPETYKHYILATVAYLFENRLSFSEEVMHGLPFLSSLLAAESNGVYV